MILMKIKAAANGLMKMQSARRFLPSYAYEPATRVVKKTMVKNTALKRLQRLLNAPMPHRNRIYSVSIKSHLSMNLVYNGG